MKRKKSSIAPEPLSEVVPLELNTPNNTMEFFNPNAIYDIAEPPKVSEHYINHRYAKQILAWRRDEYGFLPVDYKFKENNRIDWQAMIETKYLVPNKERFPEGTDLKSLNVDELDSGQLLILLNGCRNVLLLRGYKSLKKAFPTSSRDFASCVCTIELLPNYETSGENLIYDGEGDAHFENTQSFARDFITTIAGNRAEVRAIKNALGIEILAKEELGLTKEEKKAEKSNLSSSAGPISVLKNLLAKENVSFDSFKTLMIKKKFVDESFVDINDFPIDNIFEAIQITKERVAAAKAKQ